MSLTNRLNLDIATKICQVVVDTCKANNFSPITVVVVDSTCQVIASSRMDNCSGLVYPKFALAKAFTAVSLGMPSRTFRDKYANDPVKAAQMISMVNISQGQLAPFPGSVLIRDQDTNTIIGACAVSGATSDQDEFMAMQGLLASNLESVIFDPRESVL